MYFRVLYNLRLAVAFAVELEALAVLFVAFAVLLDAAFVNASKIGPSAVWA